MRAALFLAGLFVMAPSGLQAQVLADDFGDNLINPSVWTTFLQGSGPTVTEVSQRLEIVLPANSANDPAAVIFSAGYRSVCRLRGNFDLQVDYQLPIWPAGSGARMAVQAVGIGGVGRYMPGSGDGFPHSYATHFVLGCCGFVPSTHLSGQLRLVRSGSTIAGSFFNSTSGTWQQVGSSAATTGDVNFQLAVWSHDQFFANQEVKVAFDNFRINQGQVTCPANAGPDQTVDEATLVTLDGSNSGSNVTFSWLQIAGPGVTLSNPAAAKPTFTPTLAGGFGSQVLTFELTVVSGGLSSTDTVDITVRNVNHAPVADAGEAQTVNEQSMVSLDGSASFDPDSDPLTYQWIQTAGTPVTLDQSNPAQPTFLAPVLSGGVSGVEVLEFQLTVSDCPGPSCQSASAAVTVTVEQVNHPPVANAGQDQTANEGGQVMLSAMSSSDPDGDPITGYLWTQIAGPAVNLSNPTIASPSFAAPVTGAGGAALVFRLVVNDAGLASAPDDVTVTVLNVNDPPRCDLASASPAQLWPPNHKLIRVDIVGITDPNSSDAVSITVTGVTQDEPVDGLGDGDTSPDASLQGSHVLLRAERAGAGNGRVYHVHFTATDNRVTGGSCAGMVTVRVPHSAKAGVLDDGELYDSAQP